MQICSEPVHLIPADAGRSPEDGTALCLSGGGYRAMLFHAGVLWRLHDLRVLGKLKRISSVSGGSISAGVLALSWKQLYPDTGSHGSFEDSVIKPIRGLASRTIDRWAVLGSVVGLFGAGNRIAASYRRHLFANSNLQDLPDEPRFIFNATNVQSGVLCRFSKPYLWDYRVGKIENPRIEVAVAVAASSAFPPVLSPMILTFDSKQFVKGSGDDLELREYQQRLVLTDGGVYDNLGLETAWKRYKTILVSDAGSGFDGNPRPGSDWFRHTFRVLMTIDNQVRSLRKRHVIGSLSPPNRTRTGAYWSIEDEYSDSSGQTYSLQTPPEKTRELASVGTRLKKLSDDLQMRLINWGYAACDRSYKRFADNASPPAEDFPYPEVGV
ncbi:MAG: patatin-like phospholipase family protein [Acidobacteria bacterium]|nr:patatin-like phospholipase family protein [Acidobacteriota bacterium]